MKKRYLNIVLALAVAFAGFVGFNIDAQAETETVSWDVTYTGSGFESTYSADKAKLTGVTPGDTISFSVDYINGTSENADFYMSADVLQTLEKNTDAEGGAYSYTIYNGTGGSQTAIFDSETVGGDATDVVGLDQVNGNEGAYFSLGTIPSGSSGKVTIAIVLDGNSQSNSYMSALAELQIKFGAEPTSEAEDGETVYKTTTKTNSIINTIINRNKQSIVKSVARVLDDGTVIVIIDEDTVPTTGSTTTVNGGSNPQTGDSILPLVVCTIALIAGILLVVLYFIMTKNNKKQEVA